MKCRKDPAFAHEGGARVHPRVCDACWGMRGADDMIDHAEACPVAPRLEPIAEAAA